MIRELTTGAWRLDQWMKEKVGRLYTTVLVIGLVTGITANIAAVEAQIGHARDLGAIAFTIVVDLVLLINQLAQLHEYRQARRERRQAKASDKKPN